MNSLIKTLVLLTLAVAIAGCNPPSSPTPPAGAGSAKTNVQIYQVKGVVQGVFADEKKIKIQKQLIK